LVCLVAAEGARTCEGCAPLARPALRDHYGTLTCKHELRAGNLLQTSLGGLGDRESNLTLSKLSEGSRSLPYVSVSVFGDLRCELESLPRFSLRTKIWIRAPNKDSRLIQNTSTACPRSFRGRGTLLFDCRIRLRFSETAPSPSRFDTRARRIAAFNLGPTDYKNRWPP
jgi:hypothetical protein